MGFLRTEAQSLSLAQMHRTLFGYCEVDASKIFDITGPPQTHRKHDFKLRQQTSCINYFHF